MRSQLGVVRALIMKADSKNRFKAGFILTLSLNEGEYTPSRPGCFDTGKCPIYLFNTSPSGTQSQSQRFWRTKGLYYLSGFKLRVVQHVATHYTTCAIAITLHRLQFKILRNTIQFCNQFWLARREQYTVKTRHKRHHVASFRSVSTLDGIDSRLSIKRRCRLHATDRWRLPWGILLQTALK